MRLREGGRTGGGAKCCQREKNACEDGEGKGKREQRGDSRDHTRQGVVLLPYRFRELHFPVLVLIAHEGFPLVAGVLVPHRRALFADHGCGEGEGARPRAGVEKQREISSFLNVVVGN